MAALTAALLGLAGASAYKSLTAKGPDLPAPVAPRPAPLIDTAAQDAQARTQAKVAVARAKLAPGIQSTLLTGAGGLANSPAPVATKTLLGQ